MTERSLFNSIDEPVPPVRRDLQLIPVQHNGETVLYIHDVLGYVPQNFSLNCAVEPVLSLINGRASIRQITDLVQGSLDSMDLLEFVRLLDGNSILDSPHHKETARAIELDFETASVRPAALAGISYPEKPDLLEHFLDDILSLSRNRQVKIRPTTGLYAPHIDLRVGRQMYADAFSTIRNLTPKRVVLLATAHYGGYYPELYQNTPFIGSRKAFRLPNGTLNTDKRTMDFLADAGAEAGYTEKDRAHRVEHSIELHLLFARHVWKHDFDVVPILVSSLDDLFYSPDGHLSRQLSNFSALLAELHDEDTFYLISGDLAHVGRKFGDPFAASTMRKEVEKQDHLLLESAVSGNREQLLSIIGKEYDPYRICGFPPLYAFLSLFPGVKGERIGYDWWDESERESAVSFGSVAW